MTAESFTAGPAAATRARQPWFRAALRRPSGLLAIVLTLAVVAVAVFAEVLAPHDPFAIVGPALSAPSSAHPMGTDDLGRDVLSGVIHGARASLLIGVWVAAIVAVIGLVVGTISGYASKAVDDVLMRITEAFQALPRFFLAIVVIALFGPGTEKLIAVLGFTSWTMVARIARAETLSLRNQEFIEASRALGARPSWIVRRHVLPHVMPATATYVALMSTQAILMEASLGFLGLGDPSVMSWGVLAGNAQDFLRVAWWLGVFPGGAIAVAVLGINLLSDQLPVHRNASVAL